MRIERIVIWHGMDEKFRSTSQELWVLFANNFSNKLEVRRITRILDVVEDEVWCSTND